MQYILTQEELDKLKENKDVTALVKKEVEKWKDETYAEIRKLLPKGVYPPSYVNSELTDFMKSVNRIIHRDLKVTEPTPS